MSSGAERTWRVGALATATGVSVRTLRHYDQIGLLAPSARRGTGPRAYTTADVARLRHVLALRGLGVPLADIAVALDGALPTIGELLTSQLRRVEQHLADQQRVRRVLRSLLVTLNDADTIEPEVLTTRIKEMTDLMNALTPEQRRELKTGRRRMMAELSDDAQAELAQQRRDAMAQLSPEQYKALAEKRAAVMPDQT